MTRCAMITSLLASCIAVAPAIAMQAEGERPKTLPGRRHAKISIRVTIPNPIGSKYLKLWVPYPVSDENQTIENIEIEGNHHQQGVYRETSYGNTMLFLRWLQFEGDAKASYTFEVKRRERVVKDLEPNTLPIPVPVLPYRVIDAENRAAVAPIISKIGFSPDAPIVTKARAIYDYVVDTFARDPKIIGCGTGDVAAFIDAKKGKCADFSRTFIALARAAGVPAREVYGLRISKTRQKDISDDYHCWAEFYAPGTGWVPVDPSDVRKFARKAGLELEDPVVVRTRDYYFGAVDAHRVRLGTGNKIRLAPLQKLDPLPYFMCPYLEVGYENNCEGADLKKMSLRGLAFTAPCYPLAERLSLIGIGEKAPFFTGTTASGKRLGLDPYLGKKYLVLSFFATW